MYVHLELQDGSLRVGTMRERVGGGGRETDRQTDRQRRFRGRSRSRRAPASAAGSTALTDLRELSGLRNAFTHTGSPPATCDRGVINGRGLQVGRQARGACVTRPVPSKQRRAAGPSL